MHILLVICGYISTILTTISYLPQILTVIMHKSGKNLTINEDGDLSLIDFNIAYSDNFKPKSSNTKKYIETSRNENGDLNKNSYIRFFNILESKGLI